jgi:hypothetical protein
MAPSTPTLIASLLSLCLRVVAGPLPTPPPVGTNTTTAAAAGATAKSTEKCTTTLTELDQGFPHDFTLEVKQTVFASTTILFTHVPCAGCVLEIKPLPTPVWAGIGPVAQVTGVTTVTTPLTRTSTVCAVDTEQAKVKVPRGEAAAAVAQGEVRPRQTATSSSSTGSLVTATPSRAPPASTSGPDCTSTRISAITPTFGPTRTVWTGTVTATSHVDCKGCRFVTLSTLNGLHPGPAVSFSTTVTASVPATEVSFVCLKTPSVMIGGPGSPDPTNTLPIERTKRAVQTGI